jgi:hypothetical protein
VARYARTPVELAILGADYRVRHVRAKGKRKGTRIISVGGVHTTAIGLPNSPRSPAELVILGAGRGVKHVPARGCGHFPG